MFKVSGLWVSPADVEARLIEHPAVLEAAVVGVPVEGFTKGKACVSVRDSAHAGPELAEELREVPCRRAPSLSGARADRVRRQPPEDGHREDRALQAAPARVMVADRDLQPPDHEALVEELGPAEEALVRAAYRLIASKGIERTTLQDITDAAGVSKALAVYYFKTKENLLLATIRWVLGRVAERMTGVVASVEAPEQKVLAMVDAIFVDPRRNRDFYLAYTALIGEAARNERFNELNGDVPIDHERRLRRSHQVGRGNGLRGRERRRSGDGREGAHRRALPPVARGERLGRAPRAVQSDVCARDPPLLGARRSSGDVT